MARGTPGPAFPADELPGRSRLAACSRTTGRRPHGQPGEAGPGSCAVGQGGGVAGPEPRARAGLREARPDPARAAPATRPAAPLVAGAAPNSGDWVRDGIPGLPQPRGGERRIQLPAAEFPAPSSRARHAGYLLYHAPRRHLAHAYFARAGARDARTLPRADSRRPARHVLPLRAGA